MIGIAGLVAILAVLSALSAAVLTGLAWPLLRGRLRRYAVAGRPRALELLLAAPVLAAAAIPALCLAPSVVGALVPALDHCTHHGDHAIHLCFVHVPTVSDALVSGGAIAVLALMAVVVSSGAWRGWRSGRMSNRLEGVRSELDGEGVAMLDTDQCVAFTAGVIRPRVYVSEGLRRRLAPEQLQAVLSHEHAHVRRRDPLRNVVLRALARLHGPKVRAALLDIHNLAVERSCDEFAVERVGGDRVSVAETLLALERLAPLPAPFGASAIAGEHLEVRVRALLDDAPRAARRWVALPWLTVAALVAVASPVHHMAEHLLESWFY